MKAAVLERFAEDLVLTEKPMPGLDEGELRVRVQAAGMCGTDLKIVSGAFDLPLPLIPGHEIAGDVVEVGPGVPAQRVGQRVACYYYSTCEQCFWCLQGQENLCSAVRRLGFERDGGMAEYVVLNTKYAIPIPAQVSYEAAAVAMDALTTPWRALRSKLGLQAGEYVAFVGAGGLGLNAVQVAVHAKAHVAVIEPTEVRRARALQLGAEVAVDPKDTSKLADWGMDRIDLVVEMSGTQAGMDLAQSVVRKGGRIGVIGYRSGVEVRVPSPRIVLDELRVIGCRGGSVDDATEALAAIASGEITMDIAERYPLANVNEALRRLAKADYIGRLVLQP